MKKQLGLLAAILSTFFMGTAIVIGSVVSKQVNPVVLTLLLYLYAIPFIFLIGIKQKFQLKELFKSCIPPYSCGG